MAISLNNIEAALRAEDIESLIEHGAPSDEYDSEAKEITTALVSLSDDQLTSANIVMIIARVWAKSFNRSPEEIQMRLPAFQHIALQLLKTR